jgi:diguanylate cyclase (GGDEF)-like protein
MIARDEPLETIHRESERLEPIVAVQLERIANAHQALIDRLEHQANHDALTGLSNRSQCVQTLNAALGRAAISGHGVAVLFIDLDRFKDINDTLGHPVGDVVLREVVNRFQTGIPQGVLLARLGGDEFMVVALGSWVLSTACAQAASWNRAGFPVRVNVNVSTMQFERPDFVDTVRRTLDVSGLKPEHLRLELLESVLVQRFDETASRIAQLWALGVRLALDDFGAGYSSLSYLHRLTFDTLKIDRSFISALGDARDTRPLVESILSIAQAFGLDAVAEGVETKVQLEMLQLLGCEKVQGYLYSRPLPVLEVETVLKNAVLEPEV